MISHRPLFRSFLQAGFECSTHVNRGGRRLDLLESTRHDCFAEEDHARVKQFGLLTIRTAARWYRIERERGKYDFSSLACTLDPAERQGMEVTLDLLHFGWPDFLDPFAADFPDRFCDFVSATLEYLISRGNPPRFLAPVNEISYVAWAAGEVAAIGPHARGRGHELKHNLVRCAVKASKLIRERLPDAVLISPEPVIHIIGDPAIPGDEEEARAYSNAMFESWDMQTGRMNPELGGSPDLIDMIGVNFYERNQWVHNSLPITLEHPRWRPFHHILEDVWNRYRKPLFVAETGTEDERRPTWLHYIAKEVRTAIRRGVPMHGICLYPIMNHPGWDDDRHCHNGLFDYAGDDGHREVYEPLAQAIRDEQRRFSIFFQSDSKDTMTETNKNPDLVCLSHLRWGFVFQRPQHLMSRFARTRRVFFVEEPEYADSQETIRTDVCAQTGVHVCTPVLPHGLPDEERVPALRRLLNRVFQDHGIREHVLWYYTPMAREFSNHLKPQAIVYDCMDELSAFAGAPPRMLQNERDLFRAADLVFTGGASLYESKKRQHESVHCFPSSIDAPHFEKALTISEEPADQASIPHPRIGYAGVIDERMDIELLREAARLRPDWHFVMIGPTCKIDPASLPKAENIHYLGMKSYQDLPAYFAGWKIGMLPFALNESTRFISPTKTPEYLAAGLKVISTPIRDVVTPYGDRGLAAIASSPVEFVSKAEELLTSQQHNSFREDAKAFLSRSSWDKTWSGMNNLIERVLERRKTNSIAAEEIAPVYEGANV